MADQEDYYAILQVAPDATDEEIRVAFRRLARLYHPDVAGTGSLAQMQRVTVAYQTLGHPDRRRQYDLSHRPAPTGHAASRAPAAAASTAPPAARRASVSSQPGPFRHMATLSAPDAMPVTSVAFAPTAPVAGVGLIDGRVLVYDLNAAALLRTLTFAQSALAGVLHDVRFSPTARYVAAWGFQLGVRVWSVESGKALWTLGAGAPAGTMDVALMESPRQVRLAVPDAPLAIADDDPFRWAHEGRRGSSILTRPFDGPPAARWTQPVQVVESRAARPPGDDDWFVHQRILAHDGSHLLTLSTFRGVGETRKGLLRLWQIEHRGVFGPPRPRRIAHMDCPAGGQWYPLTATPDARTVGLGHVGRSMHILHLESRRHVRIETGPIPSEARAALSPDGAHLALARGTTLDLWDAHSGATLASWQFAAEITAIDLAAGATGPLLGVGLANGLLDIWR